MLATTRLTSCCRSFEVVAVTPHKARVFVVIAIHPVAEELMLQVKSPVAISSEILAIFARVGRGTFRCAVCCSLRNAVLLLTIVRCSVSGKVLPLVDSFFMQRAVFLRCEDGKFVFQEPCQPSMW